MSQITEKIFSELFGVTCGRYTVNELPLFKKIESFAAGLKTNCRDELEVPPAKKSCNVTETDRVNTVLNQKGEFMCLLDLDLLIVLNNLTHLKTKLKLACSSLMIFL